ncbi:MAG TPA: hypothetical protein VNJ07_01855 [Chitinophagales bacterium]|nr:hypothetical protein [Chitinophagales bacterium]
MDRYVIISIHTAEDCRMAVKHFIEHHANFLTHFEWGCYDNDHTAYAIVEAESRAMALMAVPPLFRNKARAIKVTRFEPSTTKDKVHEAAK